VRSLTWRKDANYARVKKVMRDKKKLGVEVDKGAPNGE